MSSDSEIIAQWRTRAAAGDQAAVASTTAAAKEGNGGAAYLLAVLSASGIGVELDLNASLQHLQHAAELGHRPAQADLAALVGNWRLAREISSGKKNPRPETWQQLRAAVNIPTRFTLPDGQVFSDAPRMVVVKGFASTAACDWLIELARPHLRVADIFDRDTGELIQADGLRSNSAAPIDLAHTDLVLAFLRARIAAITEVPLIALEGSQVLHYEVGQQFAAHHDFLDVTFPGLAREVERGGQRGLTLLIYLNEGYGGGETAFPRLGRSFKGRKGDALIFWNVTEDGKPDWSTEHIGTAPTKGEKWLFSQWIRVKPG